MNVGDVVRIADPRTKAHCWVLVVETANAKQFIGVMLVSLKPHSDRTVILQVGDHPFIQHETSVDYGSATVLVTSKLDSWVSSKRAALQQPMDPAVMHRIRHGVCDSTRTPNHVKAVMGCPVTNAPPIH